MKQDQQHHQESEIPCPTTSPAVRSHACSAPVLPRPPAPRPCPPAARRALPAWDPAFPAAFRKGFSGAQPRPATRSRAPSRRMAAASPSGTPSRTSPAKSPTATPAMSQTMITTATSKTSPSCRSLASRAAAFPSPGRASSPTARVSRTRKAWTTISASPMLCSRPASPPIARSTTGTCHRRLRIKAAGSPRTPPRLSPTTPATPQASFPTKSSTS